MADSKKKVTKKNRFEDIIALLNGENVPTLEDGTPRTSVEDAVDALNHEIELLSKKNASDSKKQTEANTTREARKELIMEYMRGRDSNEGMQCTAIGNAIPELVAEGFGTSMFSSLCNSLVADGKLTRTVSKGGKVLFALPTD